jgi:hypothetical protein
VNNQRGNSGNRTPNNANNSFQRNSNNYQRNSGNNQNFQRQQTAAQPTQNTQRQQTAAPSTNQAQPAAATQQGNQQRQSRPTEPRKPPVFTGPLPAPRNPRAQNDPRPASLDKYGEPVCPNFGRFFDHPKFCWYHRWYGGYANCCAQPCVWDPQYVTKKWGNVPKTANNNAVANTQNDKQKVVEQKSTARLN